MKNITQDRSVSICPLRFHDDVEHPFHRLPFVAPNPNGEGMSFWAVPQVGGYVGGCDAGKALSRLYLQHLKRHGSSSGGVLQMMVLDMFDCDENTPEALQGQIVGFFMELENWLHGAVKHLRLNGFGVERLDEQELLAKVNAGLGFDGGTIQ